MATTPTLLSELSDKPAHFSDCCAGISKPLIEVLGSRLPRKPAMTLSVGCGSGLIEAYLLEAAHDQLDLYGVEVPACTNRHLPDGRLLRVPCTASMHPDAILATTLMFVYPRMPSLMSRYIYACISGALESVVWLGHRNDFLDVEQLLQITFHKLELVNGPGIPAYELLAIASEPKVPSRLTSGQLDVWEHAALLYHGYEWQAAAEAFERLAKDLDLTKACIRCLLNAGVIRARIGDYNEAAQLLDQAAMLESSHVITPYLLGLVEYELGNFIKAEACFEVCLEAFDSDSVDYSDFGLDFTLNRDAVRRNITLTRTGQRQDPQEMPVRLIGMSADHIFEAPPRLRYSDLSTLSDNDSLLERFRQLKDSSDPKTPVKHQDTRIPPSTPTNLSQPILRLRTGSTQGSPMTKPLPDISPKAVFQLSACDAQPVESPSSAERNISTPTPHTTGNLDVRSAWRDRRRTPYTPRDAKVRYESTRELARFIRQEPLMPRDARVVADSTRELAKFIRQEGRPDGTALPPPRWNHYDSAPEVPPKDVVSGVRPSQEAILRRMTSDDVFRHSLLVKDTREQGQIRRHSVSASLRAPVIDEHRTSCDYMPSTTSSIATEQPASKHDSLNDRHMSEDDVVHELLPATTYSPQPAKASKMRSRRSSHPELVSYADFIQRARHMPYHPYSKLHTAASSSSSLFTPSMMTVDRADRARQEALRVLEGRRRSGTNAHKKFKNLRTAQPLLPEPSPDASLDGEDRGILETPSTVDSVLILKLGHERCIDR